MVATMRTKIGSGRLTAPANGVVLATIPSSELPGGRYLVRIVAFYTAVAGIGGGLSLRRGNLILGEIPVAPVLANEQPVPFEYYVDVNGNQAIDVIANGAGPVGAVYHVNIAATQMRQ